MWHARLLLQAASRLSTMTAGYCLPNVSNYQLNTFRIRLCTWVICCPVTTVVPRIIATEHTYRLACRSMVALLVLSQLVLSSDTAALKMWSTKSCSCHSFPPPPLISCLFGWCVFCELVSTCSSGVRCGTCEPHETQLTLLILPVLENSYSELVLFTNVVNSSIAILLKGHTLVVVHVGYRRIISTWTFCVFLTSATFYLTIATWASWNPFVI